MQNGVVSLLVARCFFTAADVDSGGERSEHFRRAVFCVQIPTRFFRTTDSHFRATDIKNCCVHWTFLDFFFLLLHCKYV